MPLSPSQRSHLSTILANASRSAIQNAIARLTHHWRSGSWLASHNPYRADAPKRIKNDINLGRPLVHTPLAEYIAASAIVHCFDGWSYLGRAMEAELAGDPDAARHLGYYSELRAAMSLLASEGIGVFQAHHIVVSQATKCQVISKFGSTHQFVWNALEIWAQSTAGANAVLRSITPSFVPLSQWLSQFSIGATFLSGLLPQWGLDLQRLASDRDARNLASYRPNAFRPQTSRPITDTLDSILQFWEICDPEADGGFPVLDRHLLRRSIDLGWHGPSTNYEHQLQLALNSIAPIYPPIDWWTEFLAHRKLGIVHQIIKDAGGTSAASHPDHSKQVIARATLLLRVATACSAELLRAAGTNAAADLDFWLSSRSMSRRLWPEHDPRPDSIDLWMDVEDASTVLSDWLYQNASYSSHCHHDLWTNWPKEAATLSTTERAFLWGIGL